MNALIDHFPTFRRLYRSSIFLFFLTFSWGGGMNLLAQKPVEEHALQLLIDETEPSYYRNNERISEWSAYPLALYRENAPQTGEDPVAMARQYLLANQPRLGLSVNDINQLRHHATRRSLAGTTVRFRQYWEGLPVNEAEITVCLDREQVVRMVTNGFRYDVDLNQTTASINPDLARQRALDYLQVTEGWHYEKTDLMVYANRETARLAYRIRIEPKAPLGDWEVLVDAHDGTIFKAEDKACYYKGHKHVHPKEGPSKQPLVYQQWYELIFMADGTGNVWDNDPLSTANETYGGNYADNGDATNA
ncbi:MAG: hypothetical protein AAGD05_19355, partial [Bacteroidota bacterium]